MFLVRVGVMKKLGRLLLVTCVLGTSACVGDPTEADEFEPNSAAAPSALGNFSDSGTFETFDLTLHDAADEDAFALTISDGGIDGNPEVRITAIAEDGGELALSVDFDCSDDSGGHQDTQTGTEPSVMFTTSCPGGGFLNDDDSGSAKIVVSRKPGASTEPMFYQLRIDVD